MREAHAPGAAPAGMIPLAVPNLGDAERDAVLRALEGGFVSSVGPEVDLFESEFAALVGSKFAVACSSGTAAIHVALRLAQVGAGDEVFCSDFTFIGSSNPIAYLGARTTLVDSEPKTWNMDPDLVEAELTRRLGCGEPMPKALELVHVLGQPAQAARLLEIGERFQVPIIEDAAESLGATWTAGPLGGRHTGSVGMIGCFSFNGNKIVTAGGGGMIVTNDADLARRAKHLTTQAKVPDVGYLHDEVAYNYRLTNLAAALGLAQLRRLPEFVSAKADIAQRYDAAFADLPVQLPPRIAGDQATYWLYSLLTRDLQERDDLISSLIARGVQARTLWRPLRDQPPFADAARIGGDVGSRLFARGVSLPCSTSITDVEVDVVIAGVRAFYGE